MKCISVFLLLTAGAAAQNFVTGQAARLVIGQTTFTNQDPNSSDTVLGAASGIAYAADTLFVADSNRMQATPDNNRVLLFQNLSSQLPALTDELPNSSYAPGRNHAHKNSMKMKAASVIRQKGPDESKSCGFAKIRFSSDTRAMGTHEHEVSVRVWF